MAEAVVLDTDVASRIFKRDLPNVIAGRLVGYRPVISFVTLAELTQWVELRSWGNQRRERLERWLQPIPILPATSQVSRKWGEISAYARRRGRPRPQNDSWVAACCLVYETPLATLNVRDYSDFAEHEGLILL